VETESKPHLADVFVSINDQGHAAPVEHNLLELLAVAVNAVLIGADTFADIELWAGERLGWLRGYLRLENGIPSHDLFGRLFGLIAPEEFETVCQHWVGLILPTLKSAATAAPVGKISPRANQVETTRQQLAGAFTAGSGLVLGQRVTVGGSSGKTANNTPAIPELLANLALSDCIVTVDTPDAPTEIAQAIRDRGGDYVFTAKDTHPTLAASLRDFHARFKANPWGIPHTVFETTDKKAGRSETCRCFAVAQSPSLAALKKWPNLQSFAITESERCIRDKTFLAHDFHISSLPANAERLTKVVNASGWSESPLRWHMSVSFADDQMRVRPRYAARNLATLKQITQNLIRFDPIKRKGGVRARRFVAAISDDYRSHLLGLA